MHSFSELLYRANELQGTPIPELAESLGFKLNPRDTGTLGKLIERAILGEHPSPESADWSEFGVEIKAVQIGHRSDRVGQHQYRPHQDVRLTVVRFPDDLEQGFFESTVFHRLRSILFAPIYKIDDTNMDSWFLRSPFIWMPSAEALRGLRDDFESYQTEARARIQSLPGSTPDDLAGLMPRGEPRRLFAKTQYYGNAWKEFSFQGIDVKTRPRTWYLRPLFCEKFFSENIPPR